MYIWVILLVEDELKVCTTASLQQWQLFIHSHWDLILKESTVGGCSLSAIAAVQKILSIKITIKFNSYSHYLAIALLLGLIQGQMIGHIRVILVTLDYTGLLISTYSYYITGFLICPNIPF